MYGTPRIIPTKMKENILFRIPLAPNVSLSSKANLPRNSIRRIGRAIQNKTGKQSILDF